MNYNTLLILIGLFLTIGCNNSNKNEEVIMNENHLAQETSEKKIKNLKLIEALSILGEQYISKAITAVEFANELSKYMTEDVVFWSNYTPKEERLRPLFMERQGIKEIMERYDYESKHEKIKEGTGLPTDISVNENVIYYSQDETASFFDGEEVTWKMVTKIIIEGEKIKRLEMYLDSAPIEAVYNQ